MNPLYILFVLCTVVAVSEYLVRYTWLRNLGTALLAILVTAVAANVGLIPAGSTPENPVPIYDGIFEYLAPLAVFWLVLPVNLGEVMKAGLPMIGLFLFRIVRYMRRHLAWDVGRRRTGVDRATEPRRRRGMFAGTYTGGSVNFNAVALHYEVVREGLLYTGAIVVDNIATTVWMVASLGLPAVLRPLWPKTAAAGPREDAVSGPILGIEQDTEQVHPVDLAILLALGFGALALSHWLSETIGQLTGAGVPMILVLTVIALALAQVRRVSQLRGIKAVGLFSVYLFLAVIGAFCDVTAMGQLGGLGVALLVFATITVLVHGASTLIAARVFRIDPVVAIVASQSNVGGAPSALAIARSLGREDLVLAGILCGLLGNGIGTFLGFWVAGILN